MRRYSDDLASALRFYTRLPVPVSLSSGEAHAPPNLARIAWAVPIAGLAVGTVGAVALGVVTSLGLAPLVCAVFAIAALVAVTGALHEDGVADTADGLLGGATSERRLEIMRDSRLGTYGVLALVLSIGMRVALLADVLTRGGLLAAVAALLAAAALSRVAGLWPIHALPSARKDGAAIAVGSLPAAEFRVAAAVASAAAALLVAPALGWTALFGAILATALSAWLVAHWASIKIGGYTGDISGAAQQVAEIAVYASLALALAPR